MLADILSETRVWGSEVFDGNGVRTSTPVSHYQRQASTASCFETAEGTGDREVGEAGFHFYRARFYQPGIGRFSQEDPIDADGPSRYAYVLNAPTSYRDPAGLWTYMYGWTTSGGFAGHYGGLSVGIAMDTHGNVGLIISAAPGGAAMVKGASAGAFWQVTNADTICKLTGWGSEAGGSGVPRGPSPFTVGVDHVSGTGYHGGQLALGVGTPSTEWIELHGQASYSWLRFPVNLVDFAKRLLGTLRGPKPKECGCP